MNDTQIKLLKRSLQRHSAANIDTLLEIEALEAMDLGRITVVNFPSKLFWAGSFELLVVLPRFQVREFDAK